MVKKISKNFSKGWFTWFDSWAASLASKWRLHSSRIVWCKRFFIYRLPKSDWFKILFITTRISLQNVRSTGSFLTQGGLKAIWHPNLDLFEAVHYLRMHRQCAEDWDVFCWFWWEITVVKVTRYIEIFYGQDEICKMHMSQSFGEILNVIVHLPRRIDWKGSRQFEDARSFISMSSSSY